MLRLNYDDNQKATKLGFMLSIGLFRPATKILLLAFFSRAAWHYRYYITKVGQWREDVLEGYAPFCYNFHATDGCTINFTGFFNLYF